MYSSKSYANNLPENAEPKARCGLSPLNTWALSFGCIIGWGFAMMPGSTFLPVAGPVGTVLAFLVGSLLMFVLARNYSFLIKRHPNDGGSYVFIRENLGYDHAFFGVWFLILGYTCPLVGNSSAFIKILNLIPGVSLKYGYLYTVAGYPVYLGEVIAAILILFSGTLFCSKFKYLAYKILTVLAIILFAGILFCGITVLYATADQGYIMKEPFSDDGLPFLQVLTLTGLMPWAFAGFEAVNHSSEEFNFSRNKNYAIMCFAVFCGTVAYCLPTLSAVSVVPLGYTGWMDYFNNLGNLSSIRSLPVMHAAYAVMGEAGIVIFFITAICAVATGILGFNVSAAHLVASLAGDKVLPERLAKKNRLGVTESAMWFIFAIAVISPFFGAVVIGWIIDLMSICITIAYAYISLAAYKEAKAIGNKTVAKTGAVGFCAAMAFGLIFLCPKSVDSPLNLAPESYLLLAIWAMTGLFFFWYVFRKEKGDRMGRDIAVWVSLLVFSIYSTLVYGYEVSVSLLSDGGSRIVNSLMFNSLIQMTIIVLGIVILTKIIKLMQQKAEQLELEKNKAKTTFLFNMSHDLRTPMNAVINYSNLARDCQNDKHKLQYYISQINSAGEHLLSLIDDMLEMSVLETGRLDLIPSAFNIRTVTDDVCEANRICMEEKNITFNADTSGIKNKMVICDRERLTRIYTNLLSNACKFTDEGGTVDFSLREIMQIDSKRSQFEIVVKDSGIGMSDEFKEKVFEAFERERTSTESGLKGTGLGLTITKRIVNLMNGTIELDSAIGEGSKFVIKLVIDLDREAREENIESVSISSRPELVTEPEVEDVSEPVAEEEAQAEEAAEAEQEEGEEKEAEEEIDFSTKRLLMVEDNEINREIGIAILSQIGFQIDAAENGQIALDMVASAEAGYYDAVLMDIQMPVMDGYEATREIRKLDDPGKAGVPIIAVTANVFSADIQAALDAGMDDHIGKPVNGTLLINALKRAFQKAA